MSQQFLKYHKERPILVDLPCNEHDLRENNNKISIYFTDKNVIDEYSQEHYFVVDVKDREKFKGLTNKIIEHYVYKYLKEYLKLFSIEGDIYIKFNFV